MKLESIQQLAQATAQRSTRGFNYHGHNQTLKSFSMPHAPRPMLDLLASDLNLEKFFANK